MMYRHHHLPLAKERRVTQKPSSNSRRREKNVQSASKHCQYLHESGNTSHVVERCCALVVFTQLTQQMNGAFVHFVELLEQRRTGNTWIG